MNARNLRLGLQLIHRCPQRSYLFKFSGSPILQLLSRSYASNLKRYTEQHEWVEIDGDRVAGTVGITDYAQQLLGDVVFVELPQMDMFVNKGDELGAVESVKSASDIYSPVSGQIFEVNEELTARPNLINKAAEKDGWICKIAVTENEKELNSLLSEEEYNKFLAAQHDEEMEDVEPQSDRKKS